MSIALPNNKKERWDRYLMLVRQGNMTLADAEVEDKRCLRNTNQGK